MFWTANLLLPTSRRNLTRGMGMDGSVWWDPTLGVFSHILKGLSYISHWRPSIFSYLKVLLEVAGVVSFSLFTSGVRAVNKRIYKSDTSSSFFLFLFVCVCVLEEHFANGSIVVLGCTYTDVWF